MRSSSSNGSPNNRNVILSIITIVYNGEKEIEKTIQSVIANKQPGMEYIIIDGGSNDGTLTIINQYIEHIDKLISEPDLGISDAFNKGIRNSTGKWLNFLNGGDCFLPGILQEYVVSCLSRDELDIVHGRIRLVDDTGLLLAIYGKAYKPWRFHLENSLPHQAMFINRQYFEIYGQYNLDFKIAMDYEHLLRKNKLETCFINKPIANMLYGGISQTKLGNVTKEFKTALAMHKKHSKLFLSIYYFFKYLTYLKSKYKFNKIKRNAHR